jgi:CRP-like cAMP-binding protein
MDDLHPFVLKRILALRQFRVLAAAELRELASLAENVSEARFAKGAVLAKAGVRQQALHLVLDGEVELQPSGQCVGPRDVLGALEVFAKREPTMTATATRPTHTLQLLASDVTDLLEENYSVLRATLQDLAARMVAHASSMRAPLTSPIADPLGFVDRLILLRKQPPFANARIDALAMLARAFEEVRVPAGTVLARRGEPAAAAFIVVEGMLQVANGDGIARTLEAGDTLSSFETLAELPHAVTATARTPVRALAHPATAIYDVIEDHTDLGLTMIRGFARELIRAPVHPNEREPRRPVI